MSSTKTAVQSARETILPAAGSRPVGAADEDSAADAVQRMFDEIAPRYDLLNHALSGGVDHLWWRRTARSFREILERPDAAVLDLCCGTGDMTLALLRYRPEQAAAITAVDFSHEMLARGIVKFNRARPGAVVALEADALDLPVADASMDLVVSAFGFRNLANYDRGLAEIFRLLRPAGQVGILEFNEPVGPMGPLVAFYFRRILPRLGRWLSGSDAAYSYLPASVRGFPEPEEMLTRMRAAGLSECSWIPYTFGIAGLYVGKKA